MPLSAQMMVIVRSEVYRWASVTLCKLIRNTIDVNLQLECPHSCMIDLNISDFPT